MRLQLGKRNLGGIILAALAAGTWSLPAAAAPQDDSAQPQRPAQSPPTASSTAHLSKTSTSSNSARSHRKSSARRRSKKVKGQAAPTPERITEIQQALANKGAFDGAPNGKWDDSTVAAMKRFQSSNGLTPTGKLDALTLQKLGLGSETTGLAPPTPPPNSANRLRNNSSSPADPNN